jgi:hypothetical protein
MKEQIACDIKGGIVTVKSLDLFSVEDAEANTTYAVVNKKGNKKPPVGDAYAEVDFSKKKKGGKKGSASG